MASRDGGCQKNQGSLVQAINSYFDAKRSYPPAYVYAADPTGTHWNIAQQLPTNPFPANGYIHWSGLLVGMGYLPNEEGFACAELPNSGAPNTNPGPNAAHWEPGQVNDLGASAPAAIPNDRQAKRLAYAANGAVMPRNKFTDTGSPRMAKLFDGNPTAPAADTQLDGSKLIAFTEWAYLPGNAPSGGWAGLASGGSLYKAHRPITPFMGLSSGTNVYAEPNGGTTPRFRYPTASEILPLNQLSSGFFSGGDVSELNAVGRHHAGGRANFAFLDGHVERLTVLESIQQRKWGRAFYTITGKNAVQP
jgi:prepilin-type processing-associated H-X9-DG protein